MKRGDVVTVVLQGDYGKPRPAVVVQSDRLADTDSVLVCLLTSLHRDEPLYRLTVEASAGTGLRETSQIMVDKIAAIRRDRCRGPVGRLEPMTLTALNGLLAFAIGLAEEGPGPSSSRALDESHPSS